MDVDMENINNSSSNLSWEEAKGLCEEVGNVFEQSLKDGERLHQLKAKFESLRSNMVSQQKSSRQTVNEMVIEITKIQRYEDERDNSDEMQRRLNELEKLKQELQNKLHELKEEQLVSETNIENLVIQYEYAQQRYTEECIAREKDIPRLKQNIALYASITGIKWDSSSQNIAGRIHVPERKHVSEFQVDASTSAFDIANDLWNIIDEAHRD